MNEIIKKKFLDSMSLEAYPEYIESKKLNQVVYESFLGDLLGFIYIKSIELGYGIRISCSQDKMSCLNKEIISLISPYLNEDKEKCYVFINSNHEELINFFHKENFILHYRSFNMELHREDLIEYNIEVPIKPYIEKQNMDFINLLGEAFVPIRSKLNLEPYNWYINNQEKESQYFKESSSKGNLFGYYIKDELVGVLEVVDHALELIAVKTTYQGKGIGSLLLKKAINIVFSNPKNNVMTIAALQGNDQAQNLYIKHGFTEVANQTILKRIRDE